MSDNPYQPPTEAEADRQPWLRLTANEHRWTRGGGVALLVSSLIVFVLGCGAGFSMHELGPPPPPGMIASSEIGVLIVMGSLVLAFFLFATGLGLLIASLITHVIDPAKAGSES